MLVDSCRNSRAHRTVEFMLSIGNRNITNVILQHLSTEVIELRVSEKEKRFRMVVEVKYAYIWKREGGVVALSALFDDVHTLHPKRKEHLEELLFEKLEQLDEEEVSYSLTKSKDTSDAFTRVMNGFLRLPESICTYQKRVTIRNKLDDLHSFARRKIWNIDAKSIRIEHLFCAIDCGHYQEMDSIIEAHALQCHALALRFIGSGPASVFIGYYDPTSELLSDTLYSCDAFSFTVRTVQKLDLYCYERRTIIEQLLIKNAPLELGLLEIAKHSENVDNMMLSSIVTHFYKKFSNLFSEIKEKKGLMIAIAYMIEQAFEYDNFLRTSPATSKMISRVFGTFIMDEVENETCNLTREEQSSIRALLSSEFQGLLPDDQRPRLNLVFKSLSRGALSSR